MAALKKRAFEYKMTPTIGRSHGIHAEPTTFGLKLAGHYAEFARNLERLRVSRREIATCAISGAVGTFAQIDPRVEKYVADKLGLAVEPVSTQVIPRDRHAAFFSALGVVASGVERLATKSGICSAPRCWRRKNISSRGRRDPPPCPTSAIRCWRKIFAAWRGLCAAP